MTENQHQQLPKTLEELNRRLGKHDEQFAHIRKRFDKLEDLSVHLDKQLSAHDMRFNKQDKTILELYAHMERRFSALDAKLDNTRDELKADINRVFNLLDEDLKHRETDEHERLAINHQLDQHEEWVERASKQLKIKYDRAA